MKRTWWKVLVLSVIVVISFAGCDWLTGLFGDPEDGGPIEWGDDAVEYRGRNNEEITFTLPAGGTEYSIWGTDIYTDDSCIGTAAVHAGLITFSSGGTVTIRILPGQELYVGSTRNGVTSDDYGSWTGSFEFVTD